MSRMYFARDDDVDDVTGPLSHPATNRNVYFTRRKLAPRACARGDGRGVALRCAHFPPAFGALFLHPLRTRAPVFFLRGCDAGYKFRGAWFNAPRARGTCAKTAS